MKRGNNNTKITDADSPSRVDKEDDDAGDEEQGFSTAITHDDVTEEGANNNTAENLDIIATASADQSGQRIIGLEQVEDEDDDPPLPIRYRESTISDAEIAAKSQQQHAGRSGIPSDAAATSEQQTTVSANEEDTQVSSVDRELEREPSVPLLQAYLVEESEDDVVYDAELVEPDLPWWKYRLAKIVLVSLLALAISLGVGLGVAFSRQPSTSQVPTKRSYECFATRDELKTAVDQYVQFSCKVDPTFNFDDCRNVSSKYGWPMNSWCVGNVTDMSNMFRNASSSFNDVISSWDVSRVEDMSFMFYDASSFNGNISSWNVSQVQNMNSMFQFASSFNGDLSLWNVSQVQDMSFMFDGARSFNGDLSLWNVSQVQNMNSMFNSEPYSASSFNGNISSWDVSQVQDMSYMFYGASSFNGDLSLWNVSKVQDMRWMFREASSFNGGLSLWNVSQVQNMNNMFNGASSFNGDLSLWNVSQVHDMSSMFNRASSFNGNLFSWDVSQVQDMSGMFMRASSFNGDLSLWNVSKVQDMWSMFAYASSFNQDLCEWADKNFPYNKSSNIFAGSGCTYKSDPQQEQGGPFCASTCI